ncbi:acetyltransferase [Dictyobacter alpinus]|uniref:Acetyltransferase n=1 Tax=Dictyobacter alpinus TaxID=2014873 RepID=A0A402B514_9CHLR|nr:GNAT family N-acetyltransferase [Dictyobacter alpinus]GCE26433.1 acetyltransferase [Dictyobacter alpinus]
MDALETLELIKPSIAYGPQYLAMVAEHVEAGEGYGYNNIDLAREDFAAFVRELEEEAQGIGLPEGFPAQQTYFLVKDRQMVMGEIRFRSNLTPPYEKFSGHIAYNIRPSQRGQGYATRQLALLLEEARKLHLPFVTLTVEDENPASVRVIQKNGGTLSRIVEDPLGVRVKDVDGKLVSEDFKRSNVRLALYCIEIAPDLS